MYLTFVPVPVTKTLFITIARSLWQHNIEQFKRGFPSLSYGEFDFTSQPFQPLTQTAPCWVCCFHLLCSLCVCNMRFLSGDVLLLEVNVVGNLESLSETLSLLASLNFWSSCKSTLNSWTSLSLLQRLDEQWPPELLEDNLAAFSLRTAVGAAADD